MKISNQLYFLLQYKTILVLHTIDTINYSVHKQKKESLISQILVRVMSIKNGKNIYVHYSDFNKIIKEASGIHA